MAKFLKGSNKNSYSPSSKKSLTKTYTFRGQTAWAKIYEPDDFRGVKKWKIPLYVDAETKKEIKDAGIQLRFKLDDGEKSGVQGEYCMFSRATEVNYGNGTEFLNPPVVLDSEGEVVVEYSDDGDRIGDPVMIGNGSEVELTVEVYPTRNFGNGQRLVSVKIIDLIEYNPDEVSPEDEDEPKATAKTPEKSSEKPKRKW